MLCLFARSSKTAACNGRVRDDGWKDAKTLRAQLEAEGKLIDDDDLAASTAVSSAGSEEEQAEASSEDELGDFETQVPPAMQVQLNLMTIKQQLKRLPELTKAQKDAVYEATGENVSTSNGAACALVRLYGCWDSSDCRPETLKELNDIDTKLSQVRSALFMQSIRR